MGSRTTIGRRAALAAIFITWTSCSGGLTGIDEDFTPPEPGNEAPTVQDVEITDSNGGFALEGDELVGTYRFSDADGDAEGTSAIQWMRDGTPISGARAARYTLTAADIPTTITLQVEPVAATGTTRGAAVVSSGIATGPAPSLVGARYIDIDNDGTIDSGDAIVLTFDVALATPGTLTSSSFDLPVGGDSLGTGATIALGTDTTELTISLGTSPSFRTRGTFTTAALGAGSPSGIGLSNTLPPGTVRSLSGVDATTTSRRDIIAGFGSARTTTTDALSVVIRSADVDGDGDLDILTGTAFSASNRIFLNDGDGNLSESGTTLGSVGAFLIETCDTDRDGDLDVFIGGGTTATQLLLNNGNGTFVDSGQGIGSNANTFACTDVDRDGDDDLLVGNGPTLPTKLYLNNGSGSFSDSGQSITTGASTIVPGDIDGDGDTDFVAGTFTGTVFYINNGSGLLTVSSNALTSSFVSTVRLADFDRDGDLDLVLRHIFAEHRVYENDGSGMFTDRGTIPGTTLSSALEVRDMDGDGLIDIVHDRAHLGGQIYRNDGSFGFTDLGPLGTVPAGLMVAEDLDRDGDTDLTVLQADGTLSVLLRSRTAARSPLSLSSPTTSLGSFGSALARIDVERDGDPDLLLGRSDGSALTDSIFTNDGSGGITLGASLVSSPTAAVAVFDADRDGFDDAFLGTATTNDLVLLNNGSGALNDSMQSLGSDVTRDLAVGDFDRDGDLDVFAAHGTSDNTIWLNNGLGVFSASSQRPGPTSATTGVLTADFDADGDLDLFVGNSSVAHQVWLNNGTATTWTQTGQALTGGTLAFALGDFDRDGDIDVATDNGTVFINNGSATFATSAGNYAPMLAIACCDIDKDGDQDVCGYDATDTLLVYLNDGSGSFVDSSIRLSTGTNPAGVLALDIDRDGDLDLAVYDSVDGVRFYLND